MDLKLDEAGRLSPFRNFSRSEWAGLRADTPQPLQPDEIQRLQGLNDRLSIHEIEDIYLPLSRLLSMYVGSAQKLFRAMQKFLGPEENGKMPYIIGVGGSVAVGKSTTSRVLQALLGRWPNTPKVALVTTDGFLLPNAVLEREGLMGRKGFPESYDLPALLLFLHDIKAGRRPVRGPVYSHFDYDVMPNASVEVDQPDILIVEGLNVLQTGRPPKDGKAIPFVSDFFDFKIYIDADEAILERWYVERFMRLRDSAFRDPKAYFHRYSSLSDEEADATARSIWRSINLVNLRENILPTRQRADLILRKGGDHEVEAVSLRKL
ncbi:pantothenate kinase [Ancylobacter novellus DSM 506]|uniref:Pantothenate kinase n=1 Tax=Ancylobacter novellus (strain ATCC 8093 / DSM 506 / JCM 20403 / CCM 1077 / IAM 12100 / NBRC 12443 / NCIMB 10456) TaxID=639283 RepID=D6ZYY3_ANCN5|nr:type I pantothenate kinase [Ancylobacter novellus]ADH91102.1 pantothenate kinase [Ancylobacter novellus DSM 506]